MSRQIEMAFSYSKNDEISEPVFPQDLLADIIETRVSYAASLNLDIGLASDLSLISKNRNWLNTKI